MRTCAQCQQGYNRKDPLYKPLLLLHIEKKLLLNDLNNKMNLSSIFFKEISIFLRVFALPSVELLMNRYTTEYRLGKIFTLMMMKDLNRNYATQSLV